MDKDVRPTTSIDPTHKIQATTNIRHVSRPVTITVAALGAVMVEPVLDHAYVLNNASAILFPLFLVPFRARDCPDIHRFGHNDKIVTALILLFWRCGVINPITVLPPLG
jgi:hypothetical protein